MAQWLAELERELSGQKAKFHVLMDLRDLKPLPPDAKVEMKRGQKLLQDKGRERSAVILSDPVTTVQFQRLAREMNAGEKERYFDASTQPDWERLALAWLKSGVDPDKARSGETVLLS